MTQEYLFNLANPIGIIGVIIILIAYFLLNTGRWRANSYIFQWCNLVGAIMILYSLYFHWNLASVVIEVAWLMISIIGILRIQRIKK